MRNSIIDVLKNYVKGKDENKYPILEGIYASNAVVEFEIRSDKISFPNQIVGNRKIAEVLSADFNKNYSNVKTYYLSMPDDAQEDITEQHWLVIMKEVNSENTRIGTGYYNWEFSKSGEIFKIQKHKIYIHEMLGLADSGSTMLKDIQSKLDYPFVDNKQVIVILNHYMELKRIREYVVNQCS